ncbi:LrgB family protein [Burkholderiaceae bacterium FT117]|uniref:LrgB family protein n=1 Tax=Zeimonas sediminis TaxID=2944268 RepID=UPI002342D350|nr:LrgB family protein [Zeimonas sediminis]MCM5571599.1 LrgB family protein [Zeimonas sediminis]
MSPFSDGGVLDLLARGAPTDQLAAVAVTVLAYAAMLGLARRLPVSGMHPVLCTIALLAGGLALAGIDYQDYYEASAPLHLWLSPLFALFAVPLWRQAPRVGSAWPALLPALAVGAFLSVSSGVGAAVLFGHDEVAAVLAVRSATTVAALDFVRLVQGPGGLTVVTVVLTAIFGACVGPAVMRRTGIHDERAVGFSLGLAANAIGTARAFAISDTAGSFACIGMILNAFVTIGAAWLLMSWGGLTP